MVTISIDNIEIKNIYNRMARTIKPLNTFIMLVGTREHTLRVMADNSIINNSSFQSWVTPKYSGSSFELDKLG